MNQLTDLLGQVPPAAAYAILALALLVESNLVLGVFVPTLTMMLTAGALAQSGYLHIAVVVAVAAVSVVLADVISYRTGRFLGGRLRTNRLGRRISADAWSRAEATMARHGGRAVFPARFIPLLRTVVPHLAGATGVPYRRVAPFSLAAATVWAPLEAGSGYLAAHSLHRIMKVGAPAAALLLVVAAGIAAVAVARRRPAAPQRIPDPSTSAGDSSATADSRPDRRMPRTAILATAQNTPSRSDRGSSTGRDR